MRKKSFVWKIHRIPHRKRLHEEQTIYTCISSQIHHRPKTSPKKIMHKTNPHSRCSTATKHADGLGILSPLGAEVRRMIFQQVIQSFEDDFFTQQLETYHTQNSSPNPYSKTPSRSTTPSSRNGDSGTPTTTTKLATPTIR